MPRVKLFNEHDVLQKAMELFWKKGYSATSIQDLVNYLGINRASLYDTFGGKQELFNDAFKLYRETRIKGTLDFLNNHGSIKTGIYKLFEQSIDNLVSDCDTKGCFVVNTITELIPDHSNILTILSKNKDEFIELFYNYLQKGVVKGEISAEKDLKSIASLLYTLYSGIMVVAKIDTSKKNLISTVRIALSVLD